MKKKMRAKKRLHDKCAARILSVQSGRALQKGRNEGLKLALSKLAISKLAISKLGFSKHRSSLMLTGA